MDDNLTYIISTKEWNLWQKGGESSLLLQRFYKLRYSKLIMSRNESINDTKLKSVNSIIQFV